MPRKPVTDPDNPELTPADFAGAKPFPSDMPAPLATAIRETQAAARRRRGQRGPQRTPTKVLISIRVSRTALERYRATGRGWQTRLAAAIDRSAPRARRTTR